MFFYIFDRKGIYSKFNIFETKLHSLQFLNSMDESNIIKSLDKGLRILDIIGNSETPVTISKLSKMLGINKSSALRLLQTLRARGYVINPPDSKAFVLGSAIRMLANKTQWVNVLIQISRKHLVHLTKLTGETAHIAILEGTKTLVVDNEMSTQSIGVSVKTGDTALLHCTSIGKSILLEYGKKELANVLGTGTLKPITSKTVPTVDALYDQLQEFKKRGYIIDDEEYLLGVRCIGVPIRDASGSIVASVAISAPLNRLPPEKFDEIGKSVAYIGKLIEGELTANRTEELPT